MKRIALLLSIILLCGCSYSAPAATTTTFQVHTEAAQAVIATTQETSPIDPIAEMISTMTIEEKVGQLFLARCPEETALNDIEAYHLGGYILFSKDFKDQTPESIANTIATYQNISQIPMLIAVDEEGGSVCRVSANPELRSSRFSSLRKLYSKGGLDAILEEEKEKSQLLLSLGINVNMAPVCDIATSPSAFMYKRSLGQDPQTTAHCIQGIVELMQDQNIGNVLKHFPGYGNNNDTHTDIVIDNRTLEHLNENDLIPFYAGIRAGCDAILISHNIISALDDQLPASLSPTVISYLRDTLEFNGVVITDDLVMQAITKRYGADEAAVMAVLAGNDMLCATEYQIQYSAVLSAVKSGRMSMEKLDASVYRILKWKTALAILTF